MRVTDSRLDVIARGLASGMSRREALRTGGAAFLGAMAITPFDAWAAVTGRCPHHRVHCNGTCCPPGEVCIPPTHKHGRHRCGCPHHLERCGGKCTDTRTNPRHCGSCGHPCSAGEVCSHGQCASQCPAGETACSGACVTLASDPQHCGSCGQTCGAGEVCSQGRCASQCPAGQTACGGACVTLATDPNNCGSCGHACGPNMVCNNGSCECASGLTACNGVCVNLSSDPHNCGTCGHACCQYFATESCQSGTCHIDSCAPNWVNCSGNPADGCNCLGTCSGTTCNGTLFPSCGA